METYSVAFKKKNKFGTRLLLKIMCDSQPLIFKESEAVLVTVSVL